MEGFVVAFPPALRIQLPDDADNIDLSPRFWAYDGGRRWYPGTGDGTVSSPAMDVAPGEIVTRADAWSTTLEHAGSLSEILDSTLSNNGAYYWDRDASFLTFPSTPSTLLAAVNNGAGAIAPTGPQGPLLFLAPGFHLLHRSCDQGKPFEWEEVPLDSVVLAKNVTSSSPPLDGPVDPCLPPADLTVALGKALTVLSPQSSTTSPRIPVGDVAWSPGGESVFVLSGVETEGSPSDTALVQRVYTETSVAVRVGSGNLVGPLAAVNDGQAVLYGELTFFQGSGYTSIAVRRWKQAVSSDLRAQIPGDGWRTPFPPEVLSHDTKKMAFLPANDGGPSVVLDLEHDTLSPLPADAGRVLAWRPDDQAVLGLVSSRGTSLVITPLGGGQSTVVSEFGDASSIDQHDRWLWTSMGLRRVRASANGVVVAGPLSTLPLVLVSAQEAPPEGAPLRYSERHEQIFAWAQTCVGFAETSCNTELRRLTLATGSIDVVARAHAAHAFDVSPDGSKLATLAGNKLYLATLPP